MWFWQFFFYFWRILIWFKRFQVSFEWLFGACLVQLRNKLDYADSKNVSLNTPRFQHVWKPLSHFQERTASSLPRAHVPQVCHATSLLVAIVVYCVLLPPLSWPCPPKSAFYSKSSESFSSSLSLLCRLVTRLSNVRPTTQLHWYQHGTPFQANEKGPLEFLEKGLSETNK